LTKFSDKPAASTLCQSSGLLLLCAFAPWREILFLGDSRKSAKAQTKRVCTNAEGLLQFLAPFAINRALPQAVLTACQSEL
jgi:hypothetical protein